MKKTFEFEIYLFTEDLVGKSFFSGNMGYFITEIQDGRAGLIYIENPTDEERVTGFNKTLCTKETVLSGTDKRLTGFATLTLGKTYLVFYPTGVAEDYDKEVFEKLFGKL